MADVHIVAKGESLSLIAKKHNMTLGRIIALNPSLKNDPNRIHPGMPVRVSAKVVVADPRIARMVFNGSTLSVHSVEGDRVVASYPAISGLPPQAPTLAKLIAGGRTDLDINTDYTAPEHQNVKDAGPIQEDSYTLGLKSGMPYDKTAADGGGWGEGGWILTEHFMAKLGNLFGGRFGFFLHNDGGAPGTSGCIGVKSVSDMAALKRRLTAAQASGQESVLIEVKY